MNVRSRRIQAIQHWNLDHWPVDLTVKTLASRAEMSVRNLTGVFQREMGMTPADFVERRAWIGTAASLARGFDLLSMRPNS